MSSSYLTKKVGNKTVVVFAFLLFYFPSIFAIFSHGGEHKSWMSMGISTVYALMFCLNYFWLVPRVLAKTEKPTLYFIINFLLVIGLCVVIEIFMLKFHTPPPGKCLPPHPSFGHYLMEYLRFLFRDGVMMVLTGGLAYAMRFSIERDNFRQRQLELNAEQRQLELQSLKAQLNPHFLFNTINNIYALIGFAPERAQQALHDLSGMLRFMIYDSVSAYVPLEKEFKFISDYVKLVKLRLSPSVKMNCSIPERAEGDLFIAPLLFLTIVENAFKHCSQSEAGYFIDINIFINGEALICRIDNTIGDDGGNCDPLHKESGVGLENVKRQLNLIYPGNHTIKLSKDKGVFHAEIAISLRVLKRN